MKQIALALMFAMTCALPTWAQGFTFPVNFQPHTPLLSSQLNNNFSAAAAALTSGGNGYLPIGNSSNTYTTGLFTSSGGTILFTPTSGGLNLETAGNAVIQHLTSPLTSANILAMHATPVTVVAAVTGKRIVVTKVMINFTAATHYMSGGDVSLQYHTGTVPVTTAADAPDFTSTSSCSVLTAIDAAAVAANDPIEITNASAPFTTGTGTATIDVWYIVE